MIDNWFLTPSQGRIHKSNALVQSILSLPRNLLKHSSLLSSYPGLTTAIMSWCALPSHPITPVCPKLRQDLCVSLTSTNIACLWWEISTGYQLNKGSNTSHALANIIKSSPSLHRYQSTLLFYNAPTHFALTHRLRSAPFSTSGKFHSKWLEGVRWACFQHLILLV